MVRAGVENSKVKENRRATIGTLKASFPCTVVEGPVGPYEVLRTDPIPDLYTFRTTSDWTSLSGDPDGLSRLAAFADLVGTRNDTVVYLPLRQNGAPPPLADDILDEGVLDLVLAPKQVALTPKVWKAIRSRKPTTTRRVTRPPLDPDWSRAIDRLRYRQATRGMDRHVGAATLILSGDPTTFRGLAAACAFVAESGWRDWEELHLDWLQRDDERDVAIELYDPRRARA
jgi:hypothetical protein